MGPPTMGSPQPLAGGVTEEHGGEEQARGGDATEGEREGGRIEGGGREGGRRGEEVHVRVREGSPQGGRERDSDAITPSLSSRRAALPTSQSPLSTSPRPLAVPLPLPLPRGSLPSTASSKASSLSITEDRRGGGFTL